MVCGKEEDGVADVVMDGNGEMDGSVPPSPQVLILDIGSQYSKLIDRKVRELRVHSEIVPLNYTVEDILKTGARYVNQIRYINGKRI
jgi:hypothetical protein